MFWIILENDNLLTMYNLLPKMHGFFVITALADHIGAS